MKKLITVHGMTCENCRRVVSRGLEEIEGINKATVKLTDRTVEVDFDDKILDLNQIKKHIEELGYDPM
jgi:copper chaperone CopZ